MVHELKNCLQVSELYPLQVKQGVLVRVLLENRSEERRTGRQDQLVCLDLPGATAQGAVEEVLLLPDFLEGYTYVPLEIIPTQTELLIVTHFGYFQIALCLYQISCSYIDKFLVKTNVVCYRIRI